MSNPSWRDEGWRLAAESDFAPLIADLKKAHLKLQVSGSAVTLTTDAPKIEKALKAAGWSFSSGSSDGLYSDQTRELVSKDGVKFDYVWSFNRGGEKRFTLAR